eukprot:TCALIF_01281-PA protein Name:"Protein of unknown function" AED:0.99 eAED:1.00 QI:0/0/0/0.33/1/1/3/0/157
MCTCVMEEARQTRVVIRLEKRQTRGSDLILELGKEFSILKSPLLQNDLILSGRLVLGEVQLSILQITLIHRRHEFVVIVKLHTEKHVGREDGVMEEIIENTVILGGLVSGIKDGSGEDGFPLYGFQIHFQGALTGGFFHSFVGSEIPHILQHLRSVV